MLLCARVPRFRIMSNEMIIPALKFAESLQRRRYSDTSVPKPLEISSFCSTINTEGKWPLIAHNDITYPCTSTVNVAIVNPLTPDSD